MTRWLRRLPLGVRLAALTSGTLLALLVLVGIFVHRQFRAVMRDEVDRELVDLALMATGAPQGVQGAELPSYLLNRFDELDKLERSGVEVQLMSADGSVVAASRGLAGLEGLVKGGALVRVASGVPVYGDVTINGLVYRFAGAPVGDASDHIVAAAAPIQDVSNAGRALLEVFVPLTVVAGVIAALAGGVIARRSLAPLREFASEADAIGTLDLSQRLSTPPAADEIGRLGATLNRMLERLDAALGRERQLTAEVGHELRTPLAIIRAEVELLRDRFTDEGLSTSLKSVLEEVDRTTGVIDDMLLLARADAKAALDRPELVDLGELARTVVERFSAVAAGRAVSLRASGEGRVEGDPRAIERAITNLADNGLRHTPSTGAVEIEVEQRDRGAVLIVRDTGPGVPAAALSTMFDRYTRAGPRRGAAGLGLSIVAAVAESHDGNVQARNRPEGGLELTVEFHGLSGGSGRHTDPQ
ncbi:ATP-binding protein [soil metagenome]